MKAWIKALRIRTLPLAISGIVIGNALAYYNDKFDPLLFKLSLYTALLLQILSNLANDYGDYMKGTDNENRVGPERALQSGKIKSEDMKLVMIIIGFFSFICGSWLIYLGLKDANPIMLFFFLILGILCILAAIFYTVGKNAYGYKGLGDVMVFLFFGVIAVTGSYYLQFKDLNFSIFLPAITIGLFSTGVLNMNNMRDVENDKACGKITIPVRLGFRNSKVYHSILIVGAIISAFVFYINYLPQNSWWHLSSLIIAFIHLFMVIRIKEYKKYDTQLKICVLATLVYAIGLSIVLFTN